MAIIQKRRISNAQAYNKTYERINFSFCELSDSGFTNCTFEDVVFNKCTLRLVTFSQCSFTRVRFNDCVIENCFFSDVEISALYFVSSEVRNTIIEGFVTAMEANKPKWEHLNIVNTTLTEVNITDAIMTKSIIAGTTGKRVTLEDVILRDTSFRNVILARGGLYGVIFSSVHFQSTGIYDMDFHDSNILKGCVAQGLTIKSPSTSGLAIDGSVRLNTTVIINNAGRVPSISAATPPTQTHQVVYTKRTRAATKLHTIGV